MWSLPHRRPPGSPEGCETEDGSNRLVKRAVLAVLLAVSSSMPVAALADTPIRCLRLDDQEPIAIDNLPVKQRAAARFIQEQATLIAKKRGVAGPAVLIRLKGNDPDNPILVSWVRDPAGGAAALILQTGRFGEMHSLVDGSPIFVRSRNEPVFRPPSMEETGFSYQFFDRTTYHIHLSDVMIRTTSSEKLVRTSYRQTISTGFSYGGLPATCQAPE
ncbi:hypothetical protein SAMN04488125_1088 [Methylorubrum salsuginis]|uniref:Uncharacterized protein n=2 Tax=Methylorubrum salsuginis TaxID=414703 RepID=A0A1I4EH66_9HYPH|nr:hypothetical protein SAMN04488125_1088 [Methylorubrum salsuginis]